MVKRLDGARRRRTLRILRQRDGDDCWTCGLPMRFLKGHEKVDSPPDMATIEHVYALHAGGTHDLDRLALTHNRCNTARGKLEYHTGHHINRPNGLRRHRDQPICFAWPALLDEHLPRELQCGRVESKRMPSPIAPRLHLVPPRIGSKWRPACLTLLDDCVEAMRTSRIPLRFGE